MESILVLFDEPSKRKVGKVADCGVKNRPLFDFIETHKVIPDILHLCLRITDQLLLKLIIELDTLDQESTPKSNLLEKFEKSVQSLGFEFRIFRKDSKGALAFTGIPRKQRILLFKKINIKEFLPTSKAEQIQHLWTEFLELEQFLHTVPTPDSIDEFEDRAKAWVQMYGQSAFMSSDVVCYMHILSAHIPQFMRMYGRLSDYSMEQFEKANDVLTMGYFKGSNHRGVEALKQVMRRQLRVSILCDTVPKRVPRRYLCKTCRQAGHRSNSCNLS